MTAIRPRIHAEKIARAGVLLTLILIATGLFFGRSLDTQFPEIGGLLPALGLAALLLLLSIFTGPSEAPRIRLSTNYTIGFLFASASLFVAAALFGDSLLVDPIERIHFIKYGLLSFFAFFSRSQPEKRSAANALLLATLFSCLVGACEECAQLFIPKRVFDLRDMGLNCFGALLGSLLAVFTLASAHLFDLRRELSAGS